ncbi:MAG: lysophospholipid acyltransferase family protein [Candidatus Omnitrophica bacterium]|nr:lysophospholipid acyltransferase family protein [Candidatus Omnitrophota bacterium]
MVQYFLYRIVIFIIHCLGRQRAYGFARLCADIHYYSSPTDRRAVTNNLQQILKTRDGLPVKAREVFRNFGTYLVDFFFMDKMVDARFVKEQVSIEGYEHLTSALARGKGVVILAAHIGNWEMGAAVMNQLGHPLTAIALPHKDRRVNELFNRQRIAQGVTVIPSNIAVRGCVLALRKNKCVAVLGDRDFGSFGEPLVFLGRPTLIPKGAAFFAHKAGAAIVPSFFVPDGRGRYVLSFGAAIIAPEGPADNERDIELSLMKQCVAAIECKVRENPLRWLMFREFGIEYEDLSSHSRLQRGAGLRAAR